MRRRSSVRKSVRLGSSESQHNTKPSLASLTKAKKPRNILIKQKVPDHDWKENEVKALIAAIKRHPLLWADEYRTVGNSVRAKEWKKALMEMKIPELNLAQIKKKWVALRKNLKRTNRTEGCSWKWEKYLLFLGTTSQDPSSNEKLVEIEDSDSSVLFPETEATSTSNRGSGLDHNLDINKTCTSRYIQADVSSSTPCASTSSKTADPNTTFCNYLLAELCLLSDVEARHLRGLLMQVMYDFMENLQAQPPRQSNYY